MNKNLPNEGQTLSRHHLADGVRLTCVTTKAFKTAAFSAAFVLPLGAENAPFAVLPFVLYRGTQDCPNLTALGQTLDELYGARVEPFVRKVGESLSIGFVAAGVDAGSVPAGEDPTGQIAHLLCDLMCRPCLEDGHFRTAETESERQNLIDRIRSLKNNPRSYAVRRTQELMCKDEPFGACEYGSQQGAQALTPEMIWAAYEEVRRHARVELFYCGSADPETVAAAFADGLDLPQSTDRYQTEIDVCRMNCKPRTIVEDYPATQGKLTLGLRTGLTGADEAYPALMLYAAVLGGYTGSRLFVNVREKLSLCYYASATLDKVKGLLMIASGIENDKYDEALGEILRQMEDLHTGGLTRDELERARRTLISQIRSLGDSPLSLENYWHRQAVADFTTTPEQLIDKLERVERGQVMAVGRQVALDLICFLKGVGV